MGKRILVADDSLTIQRAFSMVLAGSEFEPSFAKSVETGLAAVRKSQKPELILADINLGNESGYDFCSMLKADSSTRTIPVYILASEQTPYDETRGRRVGADGCLVKPFDSQALLDSLAQAFSKPVRDVLETKETPGAFTVDTSSSAFKEPVSSSTGDMDDDYSEMVIERAPSPPPPAAWNARPAPRPSAAAPVTASPAPPSQPAFGAPRPSLIPGARPSPAPTFGRPPAPPPPSAPVASAGNLAKPAANRTIMGLPSVRPPIPQSPVTPPPPVTKPIPPAISPPVGAIPVAPFVKPTSVSPVPPAPLPRPSAPPPPLGIDLSQVTRRVPTPFPPTQTTSPAPIVSTAVDRTMEAIAARGAEYAAIAKLSREVIEQVVWEVVPELAEVIIRQEIDRLVSAKK